MRYSLWVILNFLSSVAFAANSGPYNLPLSTREICECPNKSTQARNLGVIQLVQKCNQRLEENACTDFAKNLSEKDKLNLEVCTEASVCASRGDDLKQVIMGCNDGYWNFGQDAADEIYKEYVWVTGLKESLKNFKPKPACKNDLASKQQLYVEYNQKVSAVEGLAQTSMPDLSLGRLSCGSSNHDRKCLRS